MVKSDTHIADKPDKTLANFTIDNCRGERYNSSPSGGKELVEQEEEFLNAVVAILKFYINKEDKKNGNEE